MKKKHITPSKIKIRKVVPPNIDRAWLANLWYEDKNGRRRAVTEREMRGGRMAPVKRWPYAFVCFPNEVTTKIYRRRDKDGGYGKNDLLCEFHSQANDEKLVLELVVEGIPLYDAIRIVSECCERCHNILIHEHGLPGGYSKDSDEAKLCNTSCQLCSAQNAQHG